MPYFCRLPVLKIPSYVWMELDILNMESKKDQIQTIDDSQHDQECLTNSEPGWEKEALSVIKDVQDHVKSIDISKVIKVINHN